MSQWRESTLELPAVGQAASTLDYFPDAEYSHSNIADVTSLQRNVLVKNLLKTHVYPSLISVRCHFKLFVMP